MPYNFSYFISFTLTINISLVLVTNCDLSSLCSEANQVHSQDYIHESTYR